MKIDMGQFSTQNLLKVYHLLAIDCFFLIVEYVEFFFAFWMVEDFVCLEVVLLCACPKR